MKRLLIALLFISASLHARRQDLDKPITGETYFIPKKRGSKVIGNFAPAEKRTAPPCPPPPPTLPINGSVP